MFAYILILLDSSVYKIVQHSLAAYTAPKTYHVQYVSWSPVGFGNSYHDNNPPVETTADEVRCRVLDALASDKVGSFNHQMYQQARVIDCEFLQHELRYFSDSPYSWIAPSVMKYLIELPLPWKLHLSESKTNVDSISGKDWAMIQQSRSQIVQLFATLSIPIFLLILIRWNPLIDLKQGIVNLKNDPLSMGVFVGLGLGFFLVIGTSLLIASDFNVLHTDKLVAWNWLGSLQAPIAEEVIYRAWMIPMLSLFMRWPFAVIISALLFISDHRIEYPDIIALTFFSLSIGVVWHRTQSLFVCIAIHLMFNLSVSMKHILVEYMQSLKPILFPD